MSGEVRLTDVRGNVDVGTVSGDIDLRGVTAKIVRAKTTSGDVTYDGIDRSGRPLRAVTHSGDIGLHIPRDANAQLTVSTWSGSIDSQFPITLKPGEHGISVARSKRFTFEIGGGAARITADTFSGDITISSNGRGASRAPLARTDTHRQDTPMLRRLLSATLVADARRTGASRSTQGDFRWETARSPPATKSRSTTSAATSTSPRPRAARWKSSASSTATAATSIASRPTCRRRRAAS